MFPILMDEPDSMKVAPRVWSLLQDAWRGVSQAPAGHTGTPYDPVRPAPTALASLAFGAAEADSRLHH